MNKKEMEKERRRNRTEAEREVKKLFEENGRQEFDECRNKLGANGPLKCGQKDRVQVCKQIDLLWVTPGPFSMRFPVGMTFSTAYIPKNY